MAIRGHLNKLEKDQFIQVGNIRQKLGRPIQVFSLTEKGEALFPKRYEHFAIGLLKDIQNIDDDGDTMKKVISAREDRIIKERQDFIKGLVTPKDRMEKYCAFIESLGYMPNLEIISDTEFILNENNCALKDIASSFAFCCDSEIKILQKVFPDATIARRKNQIAKDTKCAYHLQF